jgi:hypothetical protein
MLFLLARPFAAQVASWHDFYAVAGGAAATLLGLVFVAMSLHTDPTGRDLVVERDLWDMAAGVLVIFADAMLIALVFLVPDQTTLGVGLPVLVLGVLSSVIHLMATLRVRTFASTVRRMAVAPVLSCLVQVLAGVGIIASDPVWLDLLAVAMGLLLLSALLASWLLFSGPALVELRRSA